jgi:hypothetical protein
MYFILCIVLFPFLFFLSHVLTESLSRFFSKVTHSHSISIQLLAMLFLPGVIIHELAHWLIASLLFVPTGEIEFFPQVYGNTVKLGSVQIAATDPFRRFFIGVAPLLFGVGILLGLFWFLSPSITVLSWKTIGFFYALFEIGNTMFSSKKDLEGSIVFFVLTILFVTLLIFLKIPIERIFLSLLALPNIQTAALQIAQFLLIAIGIDTLCIMILLMLSRILRI